MLITGGAGLLAARLFVPARVPPPQGPVATPAPQTRGHVATTAGTIPPAPRVRASVQGAAASPREEQPRAVAEATVPPATAVPRAPIAGATAPPPMVVHPDVRALPEDHAPAPPADDNPFAQLRRAEQRRDALAQKIDRLRRRLDSGVIPDVEEYQRVQAQLDDSLDHLDQVEDDITNLRRALVGREK